MKKNRMMRAASGILVATLLTTSVISGTFAKYVTEEKVEAKARVAKWGVEITTTGGLFEDTYATDSASYTSITNSVVSTDDDKVVAPGTKNKGEGLEFTIKGTPEVAFKLDIAVTDANGTNSAKDVVLKKGVYADLTTSSPTNDTFELEENYYPIVYTLKDDSGKELEKGSLEKIKNYLEGSSCSKVYEVNKTSGNNIDDTYVLTWEWKFDGNNDKADTFLGALAAEDEQAKKDTDLTGTPADGMDYCLKPDIKITITATQID